MTAVVDGRGPCRRPREPCRRPGRGLPTPEASEPRNDLPDLVHAQQPRTAPPARCPAGRTRTPARRCGPATPARRVIAGSRRVQSARSRATLCRCRSASHRVGCPAWSSRCTWQVTHQAAVKSTNTGLPAAHELGRPCAGDQGSHGSRRRARACGRAAAARLRRAASATAQRERGAGAATASRAEHDARAAAQRRASSSQQAKATSSSRAARRQPSMPLCWASTQTSQAAVANIGKARSLREARPSTGPGRGSQRSSAGDEASGQEGQGQAQRRARRTPAAPAAPAGSARSPARRP